jgi:hypothetical protein
VLQNSIDDQGQIGVGSWSRMKVRRNNRRKITFYPRRKKSVYMRDWIKTDKKLKTLLKTTDSDPRLMTLVFIYP